MDKELLQKVRSYIEPVVKESGLLLDRFDFERRGRENYLVVYIEKEDDIANLDDVVRVSDLISAKLDEIDLISENYVLDVSTSGAEKPITDFSTFPKYVGKYIFVKLRNPIDGLNDYTGDLIDANESSITLQYRVKTRTKKVEIPVSNITKANLAVKF
jgi:ribosome maturation factor RimP